MNKDLLAYLEYLLCIKVHRTVPVSGGDISKAFLLETESEHFFCKINRSQDALALFEAERSGLAAIRATNTIKTPKVLFCEPLENGAVLIMEYIPSKTPNAQDMMLLGQELGALHLTEQGGVFGLEKTNFIGSLVQYNRSCRNWPQFYASQRLGPQFQHALTQKLLSKTDVPSTKKLNDTCDTLLPETKPSLLHGDLWSGNYLISTEGVPYLIDPAVYYGHHEVDIAMTKLFGGFGPSFYNAYEAVFPRKENTKAREDLYQLYYLLVHLNLFGRSYHNSVMALVKRYF